MDLDGDGHIDLISGSWPGELFFFRGGANRTFAAPVKLKYKDGKTINIGGGRREERDGLVIIAGDATFEEDGRTVVYEGERIKIPEGKSAGVTGTASAVHAVDWNDDGVLDLLVGDIGGNVYLVPNEGTAKTYAFGKERQLLAGGKPLRVEGDAGPFVADWDGDGKLDLLVGAGDGSVSLFRNVGTAKEPRLAAAEKLIPAGEYGDAATTKARRGIRAKVCAVDWNGDGRLDLLVGDFTTQKPDRRPPTPEEKAKQDKLRKEMETVNVKRGALLEKVYGSKPVKDPAERKAIEKELREVSERYSALYTKLPPEYENHGWVWLFERKPAETAAAAR